MIIDRDKHNKYVVGWKPNYTVPTNQGSSSGTNVTIVYGGGGSGSSTPVSSEAFSYYKVSDGENAITQEAKVQKDIANLSIIGDEGIKVELITDPTIFEASFTSTGTNKGVYKISYGKVTTVVEQPTESETQAEEPTEPEVVITFPMTITYVSGEKIKAEQFDTLRLLNDKEEVATYPSSGLAIEGDADGILSISLEVYKEVQSVDEEGKPVQDAEGNPVMEKQGLYFNRILLTSQLEDQPSTQAEGDSTEEEPQQPTYESLLSFDVVVNIDTVIKLSVTAVSDLWKLDDNGNIYTEYNAYSLKELSAYGLGEGEAGDIAGYLYELGDVNIPDPNAIPDNAILQYNIETGKWEAVELELPEDSATREWVEQKFKDLINGAPADLDTLGEIAIAIQELQQLLDWFSFVDGRIRANYNFWGVGEVSAYGPASGSDPGTGGGAGYLHELDDVTINNDTLTDGQIIVWDEDSQMWVNTDFPGLDEDALALYLTQNKYATQEWVKGQLDPINNKLEEFQTTIDMINDMFEWDNGKIKAKATLYSVGEISAYGAGEGSSGTGGYLHELDDVLLTSLQDDQLLMYDATIEKWVNVDKDEVGLNETQLAQYLTEHNYAIMSNVVPITRRIIAGDGLQGGGPLSSDVTLSMAPLTASDIPGLDWSKIISGKPTTLAGYGITDGVNAVSVTGTGNAVTTASISGHTLTLTKALSFALITGTNATGTWPISITGNAATANKWTTARTITLAGAVIGSTSIDGSGNVTITTTYTTDNISALDGRYVNVTGDTMTGNLILPTLQANTSIILGSVKLEYDSASNALKVSNVNTQQVINLYATGEISAYGYNSGSAGGGASALDDLNDVTLSNLQNGQALVYNSSTGQWVNTTIQAGGIDETALAQYLTNNQYLTMPTGDGRYALKGGSNATGTWPISITGNAATATKLSLQDTRSVNTAPFANWRGLIYHFKYNTADGLNDGGTYHSVLQFNQWDESSGGLCKQLALTDGGNMWFRNASSATAWGAWKKLLDSSNYTSIIGNSFVKKAGDTMTGNLIVKAAPSTNGIVTFNNPNNAEAYIYVQAAGVNKGAFTTNHSIYGTCIFDATSKRYLGIKTDGTPHFQGNTLWHAGNDGLGSGLDADLLDGLHSTSLMRYSYNLVGEVTSGVTIADLMKTYDGYARLISVNGWAWASSKTIVLNSSYSIDIQRYSLLDFRHGNLNGSWQQKAVLCLPTYHDSKMIYIAQMNTGETAGSVSTNVLRYADYDTILASNVYSATQLQTARTINGTAFNGTSNIVTSYWGTARTLTLTGNATGSVSMNGSANVSMSVNVNYATSAGNADTLDGVHNGSVTASHLYLAGDTSNLNTLTGNGLYSWGLNVTGQPNNYGSVFQFSNVSNPIPGTSQHWVTQLASSTNDRLYYRTRTNTGGWTAWHMLAFTTDNVASASKLQTSQKIWGRPFDGTAPVSGDMTGVGSITATGEIKSGSGNAFRLAYGNYGVILRNDGSQFYLLTTASGQSASGGWNSLRPFYFSLTTGRVTMANGLDVNTITASGQIKTTATAGFYSSTAAGIWSYMRLQSGSTFWDIAHMSDRGYLEFRYAGTETGWAWINSSGVFFARAGIYSNGYVSALGQNSSDARLKTNIQDFNATSLIKQLHPKSFEWNDLAKSKFEVFRNTGTQYGLIAQDVKEVMPEWVDDNLIGSGYMGIRYDKLIPVLLQGEIETISRVETLEDKVKRLEMENSKLKAKLSKLERRIR